MAITIIKKKYKKQFFFPFLVENAYFCTSKLHYSTKITKHREKIMEKSALQIARAAYQPKLPKALQGAVTIKEGEPTQSVADQEEIKKLFPNTYGMPIVEFVPAAEANTT